MVLGHDFLSISSFYFVRIVTGNAAVLDRYPEIGHQRDEIMRYNFKIRLQLNISNFLSKKSSLLHSNKCFLHCPKP